MLFAPFLASPVIFTPLTSTLNSIAQVYARLPEGMTYANMPAALITDCVQLVKANSIEGWVIGNGYH